MDRHGMQSALFLMVLLCSVIILLASNRELVEQTRTTTTSTASSVGLLLERGSKGVPSFRSDAQWGSKVGRSRLENAETLKRRLLQSDDSGYIGYGALTGDNVPCPPQSGRSYYTPNCNSATGAVNPYTRGCSTISKCARD